jgi:hypothetical protein
MQQFNGYDIRVSLENKGGIGKMGDKKTDPVIVVDESQAVKKKQPKKKTDPLDEQVKKETPKPAENLDPNKDTEKDDRELDTIEEEIKNEVAVRNAKKGITELVNKVYKYCLAQSGITLHPYQEPFARRIIESVLTNDGEEISALFSRQ